MRILFLEPFYGGWHKDFADGLREHSRHDIALATLPARFWKWRMRGAALHFVRSLSSSVTSPSDARGHHPNLDLILATDLMSIADLRALWPGRVPPIVLYMHESQLSYPVPEGGRMDLHFGFTDITSALAADAVLFNSVFHRDQFFTELPRFLGRLPEFRPLWVHDEIRRKSLVLYPGCRIPAVGRLPADRRSRDGLSADASGRRGDDRPPRIIWNHRWEFDKQPEVFFRVLRALKHRGIRFEVAIMGENFQAKPKCFISAAEDLADEIVRFGYVENRDEYLAELGTGDVVVSTAVQENFGISVIEAMRYGCIPVLPNRLSYPELIPTALHAEVLYDSESALEARLELLCTPGVSAVEHAGLRRRVQEVAARHAWASRIEEYDELFDRIAEDSAAIAEDAERRDG